MLGSITLAGIALAFTAIAAPADPTITAPAILPRQVNNQFVGWVQSGGTWISDTCVSGLTWSQDAEGKFGQCCPTTATTCYAPTACFSGSLVYPYPDISSTRTIACTENFANASYSICNTAFVFENQQDSNPMTDIVCGESAVNWSYYRNVPASITEAASRAAFSIPNSSGTQTKSASKAWIAAVVIGPIVALCLVAALVFFILSRRRNKAHQAGAASMPGYTDAKPQFVPQQQDTYATHAPISPAPQYHAPQQDVKQGYAAPGPTELRGDEQHADGAMAEMPAR